MTNPNLPNQSEHDIEAEPVAEARRRRINIMTGTILGMSMPRRIIDGPRASHYDVHPEHATPEPVEISDNTPTLSYVYDKNGHTISYTDPRDPDAGWSTHFPATPKNIADNNH